VPDHCHELLAGSFVTPARDEAAVDQKRASEMDSGLKKLWSRRKAKDKDLRPDSATSVLNQSPSIDRAETSSLNGQLPITHEPSMLSDHGRRRLRPATSADGASRPVFGSSNHNNNMIQPMLVGMSRPSTGQSRSDTTNSLFSTVTHAANGDHSDSHAALHGMYTKGHIRPKTAARYVDIFSLSNQPYPSSSTYNEDVAERNLDLRRVALEDPDHGGSLSSRYQEEVAMRNAYPLSGSSSFETSPSTREDGHRGYVAVGQWPPVNGLNGAHGSTHSVSPGPAVVREPFLHEPTAYRTRQNGNRSREPAAYLPVIPQRPGSEGGKVNDWERRTQAHPSHAHMGVPFAQLSAQLSTQLGPREQYRPMVNGRDDAPFFQSRTADGQYMRQVRQEHDTRVRHERGDGYPGQALLNYKLSRTELSHRPVDPYAVSRQSTVASRDGSNVPSRPDYSSVRSPSALSNTSSVKRSINLANRTIMDLTGDDAEVFVDGYAESEYSEYPVIEQAKSDSVRRMRASVISSGVHSDSNTQAATDQEHETALASTIPPSGGDLGGRAAHHTPDSISRRALPERPIRKSASTSTFSPINTVVSVPPRASIYLPSLGDSSASQGDLQTAALPAKDAPMVAASAHTNGELTPATAVSEQQGDRSTVAVRGPEDQKTVDIEYESDKGRVVDALGTGGIQPISQPEASSPVHPSLDSLYSSEMVDRSGVFHTRARAFPPTSNMAPLASVLEHGEPGGHVPLDEPSDYTPAAHYGSNIVGLPSNDIYSAGPPLYESTFDEVKFARKQADAHTALIRLQQSLHDGFATQPQPTAPPEPRPGALGQAPSFSDGTPISPTSIFAQVRNIPSPASRMKDETDKSSSSNDDDLRPNPSSHQLANQPTNGTTSPAAIAL